MPNKMVRPGRGGARHGARNATSSARNSPSCPTTTRIDFEAINQAALPLLMRMLFRWLPGGRVQGREYIVRNPTRDDRAIGSFKIVVSGSRAGACLEAWGLLRGRAS